MYKILQFKKWYNQLFHIQPHNYTCYLNIICGFQYTSTSFSTFVKCRPKELYRVPWMKGDIYTLNLLWQEKKKYKLVNWLATNLVREYVAANYAKRMLQWRGEIFDRNISPFITTITEICSTMSPMRKNRFIRFLPFPLK
jgi:hypothetical protein